MFKSSKAVKNLSRVISVCLWTTSKLNLSFKECIMHFPRRAVGSMDSIFSIIQAVSSVPI